MEDIVKTLYESICPEILDNSKTNQKKGRTQRKHSSSESSGSNSSQATTDSESSSSSGESEYEKKTRRRKNNRRATLDIERLVETLQLNSLAGEKEVSYLDGRIKDPGDWFRHFEKHSSVMGWSEGTMGKKVVRYLKKEAIGAWRDLKEKDKADYRKIKKALIKELTPHDAYYIAKKDFIETFQREDESVKNFSRRVIKVARKAGMYKNGEEKQVADQFVRGIRKEIGAGMVAHRPKTVEGAAKLAKRIEESLEAMGARETQTINSISRLVQMKEAKMNEKEQSSQAQEKKPVPATMETFETRNGNQQQYRQRNWLAEARCYACNELGHLANNCPNKVQCANCSMRGHTESQCRLSKNE